MEHYFCYFRLTALTLLDVILFGLILASVCWLVNEWFVDCRLYYTKLRLGSPPKEYNVQIDTGSDILWISCSSCTDCPRTSGLGVNFPPFVNLFYLCFFMSDYCAYDKLLELLTHQYDKLRELLTHQYWLHYQVELNLYDIGSSSTGSLVSCSNPICNSMVKTNAAGCITQGNQCGYSFEYGDGSGTTGYYVTDLLYFDTILGPSVTANSSAPVVFG